MIPDEPLALNPNETVNQAVHETIFFLHIRARFSDGASQKVNMTKTKEEWMEATIRVTVLVVVTFFALALFKINSRYARNIAVGLFTTRIILLIEEEFMEDHEYYQIILEILGPFAAFTVFGDYMWAKNAAAVSAAVLCANMASDTIVRLTL